jgi:hypothetical protein
VRQPPHAFSNDLPVAQCRLADVLEAQGRLDEADELRRRLNRASRASD